MLHTIPLVARECVNRLEHNWMVESMVEMLTRPPPCLRLFQQPPSDFGDWKQAEFVIGDAPHCPTVIPRLPPAVGKLRTVLYQPFTATFLIQPVSETSRYRYTCYIGLYQVRREPTLAFADGNSRHSAILFVSEDMNSIGYSDSWALPEKSEYSQLQTFWNLTIASSKNIELEFRK